ncbi:hypothetical protein DSCW_16210 [Desulfosarcina widdelii]|uniref:DUF5640 domain-containing protein n=1 Tax=Desulfosarcina widdelii TaxID=947919 RepID=A0A5K7Z6W9_9BACT|nr:hypothetical protein [Desulfosarcina widdelii]BBO74204.1 hypothetical protein DSCW_16210 [Desulfosarcina widdelii]
MVPNHRYSFFSGSILALIILVTVFSLGCALRPTVAGKWQDVKGPATVRFGADGVFHAVDNEGMAVSGTYRLKGNDEIQFEVNHDEARPEVIRARMVLEEDRMVLIFPGDDEVQTYRRLP